MNHKIIVLLIICCTNSKLIFCGPPEGERPEAESLLAEEETTRQEQQERENRDRAAALDAARRTSAEQNKTVEPPQKLGTPPIHEQVINTLYETGITFSNWFSTSLESAKEQFNKFIDSKYFDKKVLNLQAQLEVINKTDPTNSSVFDKFLRQSRDLQARFTKTFQALSDIEKTKQAPKLIPQGLDITNLLLEASKKINSKAEKKRMLQGAKDLLYSIFPDESIKKLLRDEQITHFQETIKNLYFMLTPEEQKTLPIKTMLNRLKPKN